MEDGGALIWLVFIAIAILQGIGQRKKKAGQRGQKPMGPARPRPTQPPGQERPGLSGGPATASTPASERTRLSSSEGEGAGAEDESSEGMIPSDVWAEILGLARGTPPGAGGARPKPPGSGTDSMSREGDVERARPVEVHPRDVRPRETRPRDGRRREEGLGEEGPWVNPAPSERSSTAVARKEDRTPTASGRIPLSHGASGALHDTDPSDFKSRLGIADTESEGSGVEEDTRVRKRLFGSGSAADLRKAIVVKEVLGPPLALRED